MLMYRSIFCMVTRKPRASRRAPIDAAASPLPSDDTTPPVTRMYLTGRVCACCSVVRGPLAKAAVCTASRPASYGRRHQPPDARQIVRCIHPYGLVPSLDDFDPDPVLQCAELLERLGACEDRLRVAGELQKARAAVDVHADMAPR